MSDNDFTEAVERGAAWLDEHYDGDWRSKLNVDRLSFPSTHLCVLGQLDAWALTGEPTGFPVMSTLGFNLPDDFHDEGYGWYDLTQAWRDYLRKGQDA